MVVAMMNTEPEHNPPAHAPDTEDKESWGQLYDRIRQLALHRSAAMIDDPQDETDIFDRGARALRTLMGAAEVARRMKSLDAKENTLHDGKDRPPTISDAAIREVYRSITQTVDRVAREDAQGPGDQNSNVAVSPGTGGEDVVDQCS